MYDIPPFLDGKFPEKNLLVRNLIRNFQGSKQNQPERCCVWYLTPYFHPHSYSKNNQKPLYDGERRAVAGSFGMSH
jgi:hypothetical protein